MADIPDRDELLQILGEKARDGSVPAVKLLLEELRRDDDGDSDSGFDALDTPVDLSAIRAAKSA